MFGIVEGGGTTNVGEPDERNPVLAPPEPPIETVDRVRRIAPARRLVGEVVLLIEVGVEVEALIDEVETGDGIEDVNACSSDEALWLPPPPSFEISPFSPFFFGCLTTSFSEN